MPFRRNSLLRLVMRTLSARRETVAYPFGPLEIPAAFRGEVVMEINACPSHALEVERSKDRSVRVRHRYDRCITCGLCEEACRHGALRLAASFPLGARRLEDLCVEWVKEPVAKDEAARRELPARAPAEALQEPAGES